MNLHLPVMVVFGPSLGELADVEKKYRQWCRCDTRPMMKAIAHFKQRAEIGYLESVKYWLKKWCECSTTKVNTLSFNWMINGPARTSKKL